MSALPTRATLAGDPDRATLQAIILAMYDMVAQRLAAGTTGAGTASAAELLLARNSLGLGPSADIASAVTLDLTTRTGNIVRVTGAATVNALTMNDGDLVLVEAIGALPFNVSGVLTYTCTAGDSVLLWQDDNSTQGAFVLKHIPANTTQVGEVELATEAEVQAGTDTGRVPSVDSMRKGLIVNGPLVSTASGAAKNVTGIPAWVKEIDIFPMGVVTSGNDQVELRIGPSGGVVATGYAATVTHSLNANQGQVVASTTGFPLKTAAYVGSITGKITLSLVDAATNLWQCSSSHYSINGDRGGGVNGFIALAGPLTQFTLLPTGANTFNGGQFGYSYR